jgi:general secretion pathway protein C
MNAVSWLETLPAQERWRALLLKEGPRIATGVLGVALFAQAALIVTDLAGGGPKPAAAHTAAPVAHPLDVNSIIAAQLFGTTVQDPTAARPTTIPLVLTGVIAGSSPQSGLAIIGQNAAGTRVYAVGDMIVGGVKLHSVYSDHVVVEREGQLESLALPRQVNPAIAPLPSTAMLQSNAPNPSFERVRRMISEQPGLIGDVLRPTPVVKGGRMEGFRVFPGRDRAAFARLGLHAGDLVTAINGTPLDDRDRSEQILHTLSSASEARVTVVRGGQPQDLVLNMAQLVQEADSLANQAGAPAGAPMPPPPSGAGAPQPPVYSPPPAPEGTTSEPEPPPQAGDGSGN